ncbi:uncharacterized, partial [Tachysurus ichikawai]
LNEAHSAPDHLAHIKRCHVEMEWSTGQLHVMANQTSEMLFKRCFASYATTFEGAHLSRSWTYFVTRVMYSGVFNGRLIRYA